ncbi:hypothetical protein F8S13_18630 [Chloroflexia bacterium SDU3-3]|nr:hypothetical protein F8S13_18630 [Chloroflexia bacterium SDU3-3]
MAGRIFHRRKPTIRPTVGETPAEPIDAQRRAYRTSAQKPEPRQQPRGKRRAVQLDQRQGRALYHIGNIPQSQRRIILTPKWIINQRIGICWPRGEKAAEEAPGRKAT